MPDQFLDTTREGVLVAMALVTDAHTLNRKNNLSTLADQYESDGKSETSSTYDGEYEQTLQNTII